MPDVKITRESLLRDAARRERDRQKWANELDAAADTLISVHSTAYRGVVAYLRSEALSWRRSL